MAKLMAESDLVPKDYRNKPGNVLIAVQMGQEIGLGPMAAVQSIAVINGKPGLYGDAGKAILLSFGCQIQEDDIAAVKTTGRGRCKITRPGHQPCERTFSIENAKTAKLWGKEGPWTQYPERQMAWRAFWFAARDVASDLLKGLSGFEEARDIPERDMGAAHVVNEQPALPEPYPAEQFNTNIAAWTTVIQSGKKTADDLIALISTKGTLTEDQQAQLRKLEVKPDPEFVAALDAEAK